MMKSNEFKILTVDQTHTGWKNDVEGYPTMDALQGYYRGFNVEYITDKLELDYGSMVCTYGEAHLSNFDIYSNVSAVWDVKRWKPTGRLIFRGYYQGHWDPDTHEEYVTPVPVEEIRRKIESL